MNVTILFLILLCWGMESHASIVMVSGVPQDNLSSTTQPIDAYQIGIDTSRSIDEGEDSGEALLAAARSAGVLQRAEDTLGADLTQHPSSSIILPTSANSFARTVDADGDFAAVLLYGLTFFSLAWIGLAMRPRRAVRTGRRSAQQFHHR